MADAAPVPAPLTDDERTELVRLREELAALRESTTPPPSAPKPSSGRGRAVLAWFLVVLCAVLALLSVTTRFVRGELLDTEHYVATVAPLASDPEIQAQVTNSVTDAIVAQIDLNQLVSTTLTELTELTPADRPKVAAAVQKLAPSIAGQAESFIHSTVNQFVTSAEFQDLWVSANRQAHQALVAAVTGETQHGAVQVSDNGVVSIELAPIIAQVKDRLTQRGFGFAEQIPTINKEFVVFSSPELARAQTLIRSLDRLATVLPWLALAAAAGAIAAATAGRRWRMLSAVGLAVVISMLLLALGIVIGRAVYLGAIPAGQITPDAASQLFDTVVLPMRIALRAVAVLGLVMALVGFVLGGSQSALAVRSGVGRGFGALGDRRSDRAPSTLEQWAWQARIPLRIAVVVVGAAVVMFWPYPSGMVVLWTVLIAVLVLVGLEILIQPARRVDTQGEPAIERVSADASADTPAAVPRAE